MPQTIPTPTLSPIPDIYFRLAEDYEVVRAGGAGHKLLMVTSPPPCLSLHEASPLLPASPSLLPGQSGPSRSLPQHRPLNLPVGHLWATGHQGHVHGDDVDDHMMVTMSMMIDNVLPTQALLLSTGGGVVDCHTGQPIPYSTEGSPANRQGVLAFRAGGCDSAGQLVLLCSQYRTVK